MTPQFLFYCKQCIRYFIGKKENGQCSKCGDRMEADKELKKK